MNRSKVVSQPWASVSKGPAHMPQPYKLLCSVFLTFSENFLIPVICVILMSCG